MSNWSPFPCPPDTLSQIKRWYGIIRCTRDPRISWQEVDTRVLLSTCPSLRQALKDAGRQLVYAATIMKRSDEPIFIHVDHMPGVQARVLLPVENTEGSYTAFYQNHVPLKDDAFQSSYRAYTARPEDCTEIERVHMVQPIVLRITTPHAVICNPTSGPRVTLTLRLDKDPVDLL